MVEPLMLLLSCLNKDYMYDHPVDIMYLSRDDRTYCLREADRLGRLSLSLLMGEDMFGHEVVDDAQLLGSSSMIEISPATRALLTRLRECYKVFVKYNANAAHEEEASSDLGMDTVILRLEANPKFVYIYVYSVMENKRIDYSAKISILAELYNVIVGHSQLTVGDEKTQFLLQRFELQSSWQFWSRMLTGDIMSHTGAVCAPVTKEDLATVKRELRDLGFYGFVNPLKMYMEFVGARINRKLDINISTDVIDFLRKVVRSGGVDVA